MVARGGCATGEVNTRVLLAGVFSDDSRVFFGYVLVTMPSALEIVDLSTHIVRRRALDPVPNTCSRIPRAVTFGSDPLVLCKEIFNAVEFIVRWLEVSLQPGAAASRAATGM